MATRTTHFKFSTGANEPARFGQFLIRPILRSVDGATVNLPVYTPVQLDVDGEATRDLIVSDEGTTAGYEIKEAPGALPGPAIFAVPPGADVFEYADAIPPSPGAYVYDLSGGVDFPADAPIGAQGIDLYTGNVYEKGI